MGTKLTIGGALFALALTALLAQAASAQDDSQGKKLILPPIDVSSSRLGGGIIGTSTSVVTAEDIERSPAQSLPDILGQQAGIQVQHLYSGINGSHDSVDLRGFGASAPSNVLILVNGRRYQDFDLQGFDFSSVPLNSIERIEITRGNSGTVLYGDGAIGGVVNIVTKAGASAPFTGRVESVIGSYRYKEGRASASSSSGPWSTALFSNVISASGYRYNSDLQQQNVNANLGYKALGWSGYFNVAADKQRQGLAGGLKNYSSSLPFVLDTPRETDTPLDWGKKQGVNFTTGFTASLAPNAELIVDGGLRRKFQQSVFYSYINAPSFIFDASTAVPSSYVNTGMTTSSLTPRLDVTHQAFGVQNRLLTGFDFYNTQYDSDRYAAPDSPVIHRYNIRQTTAAFYAMNTASLMPSTDLSFGGRVQRNIVKAQDYYDPNADPNNGFYGTSPQAPPLSSSEWQYAGHLGLEYRASSAVTLFGRAARAFRLGNADERVGAGDPFGLTAPANFDLKTQTSHDVEGGFRVKWGRLNFESSVYLMELNNEIHFVAALQQNINLDPTERRGWETSAIYQMTDDVRLRGGAAYTRAVFRAGPYAGNEVPLVSRWTGNAGVSWDIVKKWLVLDVTGRLMGNRRMDNDQDNLQPRIPAVATVDAKIGGEYEQFFWSGTVQNLFAARYFDYAIASNAFPAGNGFAATPATLGLYNGYPQAGRTFVLRVGATY